MKLIYLTEEIKVSLINEIKSPDVIIDSGIEDYDLLCDPEYNPRKLFTKVKSTYIDLEKKIS